MNQYPYYIPQIIGDIESDQGMRFVMFYLYPNSSSSFHFNYTQTKEIIEVKILYIVAP